MSKSVFLSLILIFFSSCGPQEKNKKHLHINLVQEPTSLDPLLARNISSLFLARHLHEGLFRYSGECITGALCDHYEVSEDGLVYTIFLKPATYHDGQKITAHDFRASLYRALAIESKSDYAHLLYIIKNAEAFRRGEVETDQVGLKVISEDCLVYTLEHPCSDFIELLSQPVFFPTKFFEGKLCFSGPFVIEEHRPLSTLTLKKNPLYYDQEAVFLEKIKGVFLSHDTAFSLFEKKQLDFVGSPLGQIPQESLSKNLNSCKFFKQEWLHVCFLRLNMDKPFFKDTAFRKALGSVINKKELTDGALLGYHTPLNDYLPSIFGLHSHKTNTAYQNMQNSSFACQAPLKLKFSAGDNRIKNVACLLQKYFQSKLGLQIDLVPEETKMLVKDLAQKDFDLLLSSWIADVKSPSNFLDLFSDKTIPLNGTGWENKRYKQLLVMAQQDSKHSKEFFQEAQNLLLEESPIIPLFQYNLIYAKDEKLDGYSLNSLGILDFKKAHF
jgi:oligopeptide transport system substrate-binding protein